LRSYLSFCCIFSAACSAAISVLIFFSCWIIKYSCVRRTPPFYTRVFFHFVRALRVFSAAWICFNFFFTIAPDVIWMQVFFINFLNLSFFIKDSLSIKIYINICLKLHGVCRVIFKMRTTACRSIKDIDNLFLWIF